jgi:hypothetical protein
MNAQEAILELEQMDAQFIPGPGPFTEIIAALKPLVKNSVTRRESALEKTLLTLIRKANKETFEIAVGLHAMMHLEVDSRYTPVTDGIGKIGLASCTITVHLQTGIPNDEYYYHDGQKKIIGRIAICHSSIASRLQAAA